MKYLLGIDLGTSGTKTVLFDQNGNKLAGATGDYPLHQPANGWAQQDPQDWWRACQTTVKEVLKQSNIPAEDIAGIGLSGQMHGLVILDENGEVLRESILWCDSRTAKQCEEITAKVGAQRLIQISANPALVGFTAGKILWVKENEPEIYRQIRHILLPKDYLRYKLTGSYQAEVSDASGTNLLDVPARRWSKEILDILDIDYDLLPQCTESTQVSAFVNEEAARLTGLAVGTPVVGGAGDNAAGAIGSGIVQTGQAFITIGTSGVIYAHSDNVTIDPLGRVHSFCSAVPNAWTVMSCTLAAGGSLQWFRNNFCETQQAQADAQGRDVYELLTQQAQTVAIGSERLLFLPYLMGERSPLLDPAARGVFFGLSGKHTKAEMIRAIMEGVVFSQRACYDVFKEMGVSFAEIVAIGGGSRSELWRQMLADVLYCPLVTIADSEGAALGAALLAGVGVGLFPDLKTACSQTIRRVKRTLPDKQNGERYEPYYQLYRQLYSRLTEQFKILENL